MKNLHEGASQKTTPSISKSNYYVQGFGEMPWKELLALANGGKINPSTLIFVGRASTWLKGFNIPTLFPNAKVDAEQFENNGTLENKDYEEYVVDLESIKLTTAPSLEGYRVTETLEIISAECVFGMNVFRDFFVGMRDFFGGRSKASQKVLRDARKKCLEELKYEAMMVGGNAVIAVDLDYSEISGKGTSMLFLVASGTAVRVEKVKADPLELGGPL